MILHVVVSIDVSKIKMERLIFIKKHLKNKSTHVHANYFNAAGMGKLSFLILIFLTCAVTIVCLALARFICKEQDYKIAKLLRYGNRGGKWD